LCLWILVAASAFAGVTGASAEEGRPAASPPSGWVVPLFFERVGTAPLPGEDVLWLLREQQMNAALDENFFHFVRQIRTVAGLQDGANITISFDSSYESLTLHWVRIWRDGTFLNRLDLDKVKLTQPKNGLAEYQYSGLRTAVLALEGVRKGDIIDYAYSTRGFNPVFGRAFLGEVPVQFEQPMERLFARVVWPERRRLYAGFHGGFSVPPRVVRTNGCLEYRWDLRQIPALRMEDSVPGWFEARPWIQLSEFDSWAEVSHWASRLFEGSPDVSADLARQLEVWRRIGDPEDRVLAVLRFVQDDVRYFGIEIGASSHKPAAPSVVFERRFGDCKDKALLFVSALRRLGIEAYPVLVNSKLGRSLDEWQPTAMAFDHAIAVVVLNGRDYWLDPTAGYQRGSLAEHELPNYERGLVVSPKTTRLSVIPDSAALARTTTTEYFQVRGKGEPADLKVVSVFEGRDADRVRQLFATTPQGDIQGVDLASYSGLYPGARTSRPLTIVDDERSNRIQTTQYYVIDGIWTRSDKDGLYRCSFFPSAIQALLRKPADTVRSMPFAVPFPRHEVLRTEVTFSQACLPDARIRSVTDPAFSFRSDIRCFGARLVMEYEHQSLADSVAAGRTAEYLRHVNEANQELGFSAIML
jgi:transglutaminase-like putative cysteine protease